MAADTLRFGVDRARLLGGMTAQAGGLVVFWRGAGGRVRGMAGNTGQGTRALLVALALHQAVGLHPVGDLFGEVCRLDIFFGAVALPTEDIELGGRELSERFHVPRFALCIGDMGASGAVAGLAADPEVAWFRHARLFGKGHRVAAHALTRIGLWVYLTEGVGTELFLAGSDIPLLLTGKVAQAELCHAVVVGKGDIGHSRFTGAHRQSEGRALVRL